MTTGEAEILLHRHKWNKDRLIHQGRSERTLDALLVEAGLSRPGDLMVTSGNRMECPVCLGPLNDPLSLDCNHGCCRVRLICKLKELMHMHTLDLCDNDKTYIMMIIVQLDYNDYPSY